MGYFEHLAKIRWEEAVQEGFEKAVRSLLKRTELSPEKIAELLEVRVSIVKRIKKELRAK